MKTIDFHNCSLVEALDVFHGLLSEARYDKQTLNVKLITGNGIIKEKLLDECERYGILCNEQLGNSGALIATIE